MRRDFLADLMLVFVITSLFIVSIAELDIRYILFWLSGAACYESLAKRQKR